MTFYSDSDDEYHPQTHHTFASGEYEALARGALKFTSKLAPAFDGVSSWFQFEDLVEEWLDITTLDEEKRAPCLRSRLTGAALTWKPHLDRAKSVSYTHLTLPTNREV